MYWNCQHPWKATKITDNSELIVTIPPKIGKKLQQIVSAILHESWVRCLRICTIDSKRGRIVGCKLAIKNLGAAKPKRASSPCGEHYNMPGLERPPPFINIESQTCVIVKRIEWISTSFVFCRESGETVSSRNKKGCLPDESFIHLGNPSLLCWSFEYLIVDAYIMISALHYIALDYIRLHYLTLHYLTLHHITYTALHSITVDYIRLPYITWPYIHYITLR